jgi:hypothetical protein
MCNKVIEHHTDILSSEPANVQGMQFAKQVEKLDRMFVCQSCKTVFLFASDVADHEATFGHSEMDIMPFDEVPLNSNQN